jgi:hypothetical protein
MSKLLESRIADLERQYAELLAPVADRDGDVEVASSGPMSRRLDLPTALDATFDEGYAPACVAARAWHLTERQLLRKARHGLVRWRQSRSGITLFALPDLDPEVA